MDSLQAVYEQAIAVWAHWRTSYPQLSAPLVVEPPAGYATSRTRVMIVGQQTDRWGEDVPTTGAPSVIVDELRAEYRRFELAAHYGSSPFWLAAHEIFRALNADALAPAFIWSNLVKVDDGGRRPQPQVEDQVADIGILQAEVQAFAPHVVIFFCGPRYDARLLSTFPGANLRPRNKAILSVEHPALPARSFRTYHPAYLRRSRQWATVRDLISLCESA